MADNVGSKVSFFLVGLGIGALVGILFAPKSGEETREYLTSKADEGREYAQKKARELRERAEDLIERSKEIMSRQKDAISYGRGRGQGNVQARSKDPVAVPGAPCPAGSKCSSSVADDRHRDSDGDFAGDVRAVAARRSANFTRIATRSAGPHRPDPGPHQPHPGGFRRPHHAASWAMRRK